MPFKGKPSYDLFIFVIHIVMVILPQATISALRLSLKIIFLIIYKLFISHRLTLAREASDLHFRILPDNDHSGL